jgi:hypothetical protein
MKIQKNNFKGNGLFIYSLFNKPISILISIFAISFILFIYIFFIPSANAFYSSFNNCLNNNSNKKIAFVEPTFTYAAYQNGSFYNFYGKYSSKRYFHENTVIPTDISLLKDRPIPHGPFPYFENPSSVDIPYKYYFDILYQHVNKTNANIKNITDVDVDKGKIFQADGKNAYDILFLFHNEYATQNEYNNLKKFVNNGGTIVFTEANVLTTEVSYNKTKDTITLVKGHDWSFDGNVAKAGPAERWLDENKGWMGSNFLDIDSNIKVLFKNNPFNYTHSEEQYVTNPNAVILINYQAYNLTEEYPGATVATYMMSSGKGKIINLGIWGHTLTDNSNFINYFDNIILPLALDLPVKNKNSPFLSAPHINSSIFIGGNYSGNYIFNNRFLCMR